MSQLLPKKSARQTNWAPSRWLVLSALVLPITVLSGCGGAGGVEPEEINNSPAETESPSPEDPEGDMDDLEGLADVEVDQGLFSVKVTLPPEFSEDISDEDIADTVEEEGFIDGERNPDGSVTYQMSQATQDAYLEEMRTSIQESVDEMALESPELIRDISFNGDVTQFDVRVVRSEYENQGALSAAGFLGWSLAFQASFYQLFAGVEEGEREVKIRFIDDQTDEVFDTQNFPEDFE